MVIRFFAINPIFYFKQVEVRSRKTPACLQAGMYRTFQFPGKNYFELPFYWHHWLHKCFKKKALSKKGLYIQFGELNRSSAD